MLTELRVPAIADGDVIAAGCCPVPAAAAVVQVLMFLDGVEDVAVDERRGIVLVTHDPTRPPAADLAAELGAVGLPSALVV